MESQDSRPKLNITSKTTVTIKPHATTIDESNVDNTPTILPSLPQVNPEEDPKNIISEESLQRKLVKDLQVYDIQLKRLKATVENFNEVVKEKENATGNLKTGIRLLSESVGPLDTQLTQIQRETHLKKLGELRLLSNKDEKDATLSHQFEETISSYKADIDERSKIIAGHRERVAKELNDFRTKHKQQAENDLAALKEVQRTHEQVRAEKGRKLEERREQLDRINEVTKECEGLMRAFQMIADERKAIGRTIKELNAGIEQLQRMSSRDSQASFELKLADNKRNVTLHEKQQVNLQAQREQKRKQLSEEKARTSKLTQELADAADQRDSLEKTRKAKLQELQQLNATCAEKRIECDRVVAQTIEYEREMKKKLKEARKQSEMMSQSILAQMNNARKNSVHFQNAKEQRARQEREERERRKEELNEELEALERTLETLRESCRQEMETTERHFSRVEKELDLFGQDANKDHEFEINLVKERIQQLGVKSSRELADLDTKLKEVKTQAEIEKNDLKLAALVKHNNESMVTAEEQEAQVKAVLEGVEREVADQKYKLAELSKREYDLLQQLKKLGATPSEFALAADKTSEMRQTEGNGQRIKREADNSKAPSAVGTETEAHLRMVLQRKATEVQQSMQKLGRYAPQEKLFTTMEEMINKTQMSVASRMQLKASQMEETLHRDKSKIAMLKGGQPVQKTQNQTLSTPPNLG